MTRNILAIFLLLTGGALSGLLLLQHHGEGSAVALVNQTCGDTEESGCNTVNKSAYSTIKGVPLAVAGLFFYFSLTLLLTLGAQADADTKRATALFVLYGVSLALAFNLWLLFLQAVVIKAFCKLCLVTYAINALVLFTLFPNRHSKGAWASAHKQPHGRLILTGWALGSFFLLVALTTTEFLLTRREGERVSTLLGSSPMTSPATPISPQESVPSKLNPGTEGPLYQEQAHRAQKEVERLQGILDDPQKLEEYFAAKALKDFEKAPAQTIELQTTPFKGPSNAPIRVVLFSDFLCPACRGLAQAFHQYLPKSGNQVAVYYKHYPLDQSCNTQLKTSIHPGACWLALGAICAQDQGSFWPYHDKVFDTELHHPELKDVIKLVTEVGLNGSALESCMTSSKTRKRLLQDIEEGARLQVAGTPTLYVNGKRLPRVNDFLEIVGKESQRLGLPPLPNAR